MTNETLIEHISDLLARGIQPAEILASLPPRERGIALEITSIITALREERRALHPPRELLTALLATLPERAKGRISLGEKIQSLIERFVSRPRLAISIAGLAVLFLFGGGFVSGVFFGKLPAAQDESAQLPAAIEAIHNTVLANAANEWLAADGEADDAQEAIRLTSSKQILNDVSQSPNEFIP